ncbi:polyphosphate kinase 2 family protein [Zhengella sp. ZM62]|uniref:polyphosphate kinase 2 family protein n=1 Tax=Zhengella sedimenti TaxID=3390035 RepID=UPI0039765024
MAQYRLGPGEAPGLAGRDPAATEPHLSHDKGAAERGKLLAALDRLQYLLFADNRQSLLIVLQGLDASGKDGTIRHVFTGMNPQGVRVAAFKQPTPEEAAHDFLWRAHRAAPARGEVVIFNRSHYEDVLVVRVHDLVPEPVWRARYDAINAFESMLVANGTRILKFFLHISPEEQLARFAERLDTPEKRWKISESDYTERLLWDRYTDAYEEALQRTGTEAAPWYVIPSDHKWYRNLAVARIIAATLEEMHLGTPSASVDIEDIRRRYHSAKARQA